MSAVGAAKLASSFDLIKVFAIYNPAALTIGCGLKEIFVRIWEGFGLDLERI